MSIRIRWVAVALIPALLGTSLATAQQPERQLERQQRRGEIREGLRGAAQRVGEVVSDVTDAFSGDRAQTNDALIAGILIPSNQEEVALAQFAKQRTQNEQVQQFADRMIEDHSQFVNQLRQFSGMAAGPAEPQDATNQQEGAIQRRYDARQRDGAAAPDPNRRPATDAGVQRQQQPVGGPDAAPATPRDATATQGQHDRTLAQQAGSVDVIQLHRQIGERCLAMSKEMLENKQGEEFDKAFVGMSIPAHVRMLASLEAVQDYASPELQRVLQQGVETTREHLQQAQQLMRQIEHGGAQQPGEVQQRRPAQQQPIQQQ